MRKSDSFPCVSFGNQIPVSEFDFKTVNFIYFYLFYLVHSTGQNLLPRGKGHNRTSRSLAKCPTSLTPHLHTKDSHSTGITFNVTELSTFKELWDGTSSSLSEKTRKSNHLQMKLQRQHFLLRYLKTLSVGPVGVELTTSRVTARCTTKWASGARLIY